MTSDFTRDFTRDLARDVVEISDEFTRSWMFDERDLGRPHVDQVVRDLIAKRAPERRARLEDEFFGVGPLSPLMADPDVTEIIINGATEVWFERRGVLARHADQFLSDSSFKNFVDRACTEAAVKVDLAQPFADGHWRGFRLHVGRAPLTRVAYHLTLRRTPESPWTLTTLTAAGWCTREDAEVLRGLVDARVNILVIGPTGAGKTSVLNALLGETAANERTVILEDTDELKAPNAASAKLLTRPAIGHQLPEYTLTDLVRQSLRMRPDRLVIGEVRGGEAKDLLLALATGHAGSLGTLHARDARQALLRLEMLVQLGAPQWNLAAIRRLLHLSVGALVTCEFSEGRRRLGGVMKIAGLEDFGLLLESMP